MSWLARRLENLLKERSLTIQKLSDETGIARSTLSLIKTGRHVPSEEVVKLLARYFGEDEEEWAFRTKGEPLMKKLERKYPTQLPRYTRRRLGGG